jgi:hypothetical protein
LYPGWQDYEYLSCKAGSQREFIMKATMSHIANSIRLRQDFANQQAI